MRTVVALYDRFEDAQRAIQALNEHGFNRDDMNLVANDERGEYSRSLETSDDVSGGEGAATGAGIGAVLGGLGGLLVGLGALAIPGVGPVLAAGPIVSALAGAGVGAVAGGLIGALVDLGIPEEHANYYAEGIRRGGTLVTVRTEDNMAEDARMVLNRFNPVDIDTRARTWQDEGWKGFNEADFRTEQSAYQSTSGVPVTGADLDDTDMHDDSFRGVGTDLNTSDNVHGTRIGENYPRTELDRETPDDVLHDIQPDVETRQFTERDRDLGDRIPGSTYDTTPSGVNTGVPVTGMQDDDDFDTHLDDTTDSGSVTRMDDHLRDDVFGRDRAGMGDNDIPVTGGTMGTVDNRMSGFSNLETDTDWGMYDQSFRSDYQTRYAMSGYDYEFYAPAYRYGYDLAYDDTYRGYDWERLEPEARRDWESRGLEGAWDDVKDAVRHAWQSITR